MKMLNLQTYTDLQRLTVNLKGIILDLQTYPPFKGVSRKFRSPGNKPKMRDEL